MIKQTPLIPKLAFCFNFGNGFASCSKDSFAICLAIGYL